MLERLLFSVNQLNYPLEAYRSGRSTMDAIAVLPHFMWKPSNPYVLRQFVYIRFYPTMSSNLQTDKIQFLLVHIGMDV